MEKTQVGNGEVERAFIAPAKLWGLILAASNQHTQ